MTIPADDMPMLKLAARGDREALTILRDGIIAEGNAPTLIPREELAIQAEVFARLAAEHGVVADKVYLAAILLLRSGECFRTGEDVRGEQFLQETYGLFDAIIASDDSEGLVILVNATASLADDGDDLAACTLNRLISILSPEQAQQLSTKVKILNSQLEA